MVLYTINGFYSPELTRFMKNNGNSSSNIFNIELETESEFIFSYIAEKLKNLLQNHISVRLNEDYELILIDDLNNLCYYLTINSTSIEPFKISNLSNFRTIRESLLVNRTINYEANITLGLCFAYRL